MNPAATVTRARPVTLVDVTWPRRLARGPDRADHATGAPSGPWSVRCRSASPRRAARLLPGRPAPGSPGWSCEGSPAPQGPAVDDGRVGLPGAGLPMPRAPPPQGRPAAHLVE